MGDPYPYRTDDLAGDYTVLLEAKADAERLAAGGSVTARQELVGIDRDLALIEARIAVETRGPAPITPADGPPNTGRLSVLHGACVVLVESDDRDRRRDALRDLLPYVARGEDLAFLLGYQTGG